MVEAISLKLIQRKYVDVCSFELLEDFDVILRTILSGVDAFIAHPAKE